MGNNEKKRRRMTKARLARKRKQRNRMLALMLTAIFILLVILLLVDRKKARENDEDQAQQSGDVVVLDDAEDEKLAAEESGIRTVTFTEEQMHAGDLILVNSRYPYDFAANDDTIGLTSIREAQSFYYQLEKDDFQVAGRIMPALDNIVAACDAAVGSKQTGIASAYRSLEYQQSVWDEIAEQNGQEYAEKFVAAPGYSEHHTGLAVDMSIFFEDGSEGSFSESENAVWMNDNAYLYGFVRRYAEDKVEITGISNEAWHFRYVGIPHATYMSTNALCLEEYIDYLRLETSADDPLTVVCDDGTYEIFFTAESTIEEPQGDYTVSGNNVDGYIITIRK